jgi:hypothetical protein
VCHAGPIRSMRIGEVPPNVSFSEENERVSEELSSIEKGQLGIFNERLDIFEIKDIDKFF